MVANFLSHKQHPKSNRYLPRHRLSIPSKIASTIQHVTLQSRTTYSGRKTNKYHMTQTVLTRDQECGFLLVLRLVFTAGWVSRLPFINDLPIMYDLYSGFTLCVNMWSVEFTYGVWWYKCFSINFFVNFFLRRFNFHQNNLWLCII